MYKQVIIHWTPSPSEDVARQELSLVINPGPEAESFGPYSQAARQAQWSTKETHKTLSEGDTIEVVIKTIDTGGLQDSHPPRKRFTLPNAPPVGASNITFEVRDWDGLPPSPTGPTGPMS
jgi:hypothetical protein